MEGGLIDIHQVLPCHHQLCDLLCILLLLDTQLSVLEDLPLVDIARPLVGDAVLLVYGCKQVPAEVLVRWDLAVLLDDRYPLVQGQVCHLSQGLVVAYPLDLVLLDILVLAFEGMRSCD